jgi:hypothetical protein
LSGDQAYPWATDEELASYLEWVRDVRNWSIRQGLKPQLSATVAALWLEAERIGAVKAGRTDEFEEACAWGRRILATSSGRPPL